MPPRKRTTTGVRSSARAYSDNPGANDEPLSAAEEPRAETGGGTAYGTPPRTGGASRAASPRTTAAKRPPAKKTAPKKAAAKKSTAGGGATAKKAATKTGGNTRTTAAKKSAGVKSATTARTTGTKTAAKTAEAPRPSRPTRSRATTSGNGQSNGRVNASTPPARPRRTTPRPSAR